MAEKVFWVLVSVASAMVGVVIGTVLYDHFHPVVDEDLRDDTTQTEAAPEAGESFRHGKRPVPEGEGLLL